MVKKRKMDSKVVAIIIIIVVILLALLFNKISGNAIFGSKPGTCYDDDVNYAYPDGLNYNTRGKAIVQDSEFRDYCNTAGMLVEYYCDGNQLKTAEYGCASGCASGKGRCNTELEGTA